MFSYFDFIFFSFGLLFFLYFFLLWKKRESLLVENEYPWKFLAGFFLFFAFHKWLNVLNFAFEKNYVLDFFYYSFLVLSILSLFEFNRRFVKILFKLKSSWWLYFLFVLFPLVYIFFSCDLCFSALKYFLFFLSFSSFLCLLAYRLRYKNYSRFILFLLLSFLVYSFNALFLFLDFRFNISFFNDWFFFDQSCFALDSIFILLTSISLSCFWFSGNSHSFRDNDNKPLFHKILFFVIFVTIFFIGFLASSWRSKLIDSSMREDLLSQSFKISQAINPDDIKQLSFTKEDENNPYFKRISSYLRLYAKELNLRSVYTMINRRGEIIFGPENLDSDDVFASSPGTVYGEPSDEDFTIFADAKQFVVGPYSDEYGTFISASSPIINPLNNKVLAVVGIDVEANDWFKKIAREKLVIFSFILALVLISLLSNYFFEKRAVSQANKNNPVYYLEGFIVFLIGLITTVFSFYLIRDSELRSNSRIFSKLANLQFYSINRTVSDIDKYYLKNLINFYKGSDYVGREEFRIYTDKMIEDSFIYSLEWSPCIESSKVSDYENSIKSEGLEDFFVFDSVGDFNVARDLKSNYYFPITYVEPFEKNKKILGLNIGREIIENIFDHEDSIDCSGMPFASDSFALNQSFNKKGFRIYWPILSSQEKNEEACLVSKHKVLGSLSAIISFEDIILKSLSSFDKKDLLSEVSWYQIDENMGLKNVALWQLNKSDSSDNKNFSISYPIFVFGKTYLLFIKSSDAFSLAYPSKVSLTAGIFGLCLTVILSFFVAFLSSRKYFLEKEVFLRTKQLKRSEEKFRSYIDKAPDGILVVDYNGKIIEFNKSLCLTTFYSEEEISKMNFYDLICLKNINIVKSHLRKVIRKGSAEDDVLYKKNKIDDCIYYFNISSVKLSDNFILIFVKDVSKEKEVDRAKTEFVSLASHQLRTPLSAINWYSEMLLAGDGGKLTKDQEKFAQEIYGSNKRMVELVNSLLNVSRLEMGTFIIEPEPINFIELMEDVLKEQTPMIINKKINVNKKYQQNLPLFNYDPKLLRIVLQNLLSNAVKYTSEGKNVNIKIGLSKNKRFIDIEIKDEGYGIQENQQDKIFGKLFRADNVKKKNTEGTGLGLYIVKAIIGHFKGKIWFKSKENLGTSFYISLPSKGVKKKEGDKKLS